MDREGIMVKWNRSPYYTDDVQSSWLKIKKREYSQITAGESCSSSDERRHQWSLWC